MIARKHSKRPVEICRQAVDFLRKKGLAAAAKKAGRAATEGIVAVAISADGKTGALVEVNSETDFVAKTEKFQTFVADIANQILVANPADNDALFAQDYVKEPGKTVQTALNEAIAVIGENLQIRRFARFTTTGLVGAYIHAGGKIGVMVELDRQWRSGSACQRYSHARCSRSSNVCPS